MNDWESTLIEFCAGERIEEFFFIRNAIREMMEERESLLAAVEKLRIGVDDIRDALQSKEYSDNITITIALDLCQETQALTALPEHLK